MIFRSNCIIFYINILKTLSQLMTITKNTHRGDDERVEAALALEEVRGGRPRSGPSASGLDRLHSNLRAGLLGISSNSNIVLFCKDHLLNLNILLIMKNAFLLTTRN